jgi:predicted  nucleic acid-binding Zn-ribbon protein
MSDALTAEGTEPVTEDSTPDTLQLPDDHPLVKTLAAQKSAIRELKAKASRLDEIEEAQKSEAEKVADRLAKADAEVAGIPSKVCEALRAHLIKIHEIDQEDAELFLTATEPDLLLKQADRLVGQSGKRNRNIVPREGRNPNPNPTDPTRDFLRSINGQ